jgi:hypothetical protein
MLAIPIQSPPPVAIFSVKLNEGGVSSSGANPISYRRDIYWALVLLLL